MIERGKWRQLIVPGYLFGCILLGGSAQAIWGNLILQLGALLLIGWAAVWPANDVTRTSSRTLLFLVLGLVSLIALQLVPLPPEVWTRFPGREVVVRGYGLLGEKLPWAPLSLAPVETLSVGLSLLPSIAIIAAILALDVCHAIWALVLIVAATILSIVLGYVQVISGSAGWYLYSITNVGSAVGFFANRNHMGTLLLVAIPCIGALLSAPGKDEIRRSLPRRITGLVAALLVLLGIAMNGSLATILLALPVTIASSLQFKSTRRFRSVGLMVAAALLVLAVALLEKSPVQGKLIGDETSSITGRQEIWDMALKGGTAAFPVGTGFGSFEQVYRLREDPASVTGKYVNHAHNDVIELLVEGGVPALLLLAAFLWWWTIGAREAWRTGSQVGRAASIASAAVLAHSLVDYPLRTTAIAATFAFCIAVMGRPSRSHGSLEATSPADLRPTRHLMMR